MKTKLSNQGIAALPIEKKRFRVWDTVQPCLFVLVTPGGTKSFYIFYRHIGTKREFRLGSCANLTIQQARELAKQHLGQVAYGVDVHAEEEYRRHEVEEMKASHTLRSFVDGPYQEWRKANRSSAASSIATLKRTFVKQFGDNKLHELQPWDIERWKAKRKASGIKPASINRELAELQVCLNKAVEWRLLATNEISKVKRLKQDNAPTVRYLTEDEERRLLAQLGSRDRKLKEARTRANNVRRTRSGPAYPDLAQHRFADHLEPLVLLSLHTGLRRGELLQLTWVQINLEGKYLSVTGGQSKSGHTRHMPLNSVALKTLIEWKQQTGATGSDLVFSNQDGKPIDNVRKAWATVLLDAQISKFRWHDLRHHFASKLVMSGVDLNTVRELLGHADIKMTLRYAHLAPEHKASAVEKLIDIGAA